MKFRSRPIILSLVLLTSLATVTVVAQEKSRSKAKAAAAAETDATTSQSRALRRLPTGFGALNLSAEQKDQVYAIREEYGVQISALQEQLAALRMQMDQECERVLTAAQKKELAASRADKDSEDAAAAPPATTQSTKTTRSSKSTKSSEKSADKK